MMRYKRGILNLMSAVFLLFGLSRDRGQELILAQSMVDTVVDSKPARPEFGLPADWIAAWRDCVHCR